MVALCPFVFATGLVSAVASASATSYTEDSIHYDISWDDKADMPLAVSDATASVVGGLVYIIGGCDSPQGNQNVGNNTHPFHACVEIADHVLIYDPVGDSWLTSKSTMMVPRYRHAAVVVGTDIYVVGGRNVADELVRSILKYSTSKDDWEMISEFAEATSDNAAFEHDGKVITCGGYPLDYSTASADCYMLDPKAEEPDFKPWGVPLATGRGDFGIVKLGNWVYAYGGFNAYQNEWTALRTIDRLDPNTMNATSTWIELAKPMTKGRGDFAAATLHGRLLAIGGEDSSVTIDAGTAGASLRQVEAYDPRTGKWLSSGQLTPIPHATFRFCGATVGEAVYIFGGQGDHSDDCDCYPTKAGVFVYNEKVTKVTDSETENDTDVAVRNQGVALIGASFLLLVLA